MKWLLGILVAAILCSGAMARVEVHDFDSPEQEARYHKLVAELRCLVCQNQNLADSNSELAVDMRRKTYEMVKQDMSSAQVVDFMVARYGDFVLYRPPFNTNTLLLWIGPFLILIGGVTTLLLTIRKRRRETATGVTAATLKSAAHLLKTDREERDA